VTTAVMMTRCVNAEEQRQAVVHDLSGCSLTAVPVSDVVQVKPVGQGRRKL